MSETPTELEQWLAAQAVARRQQGLQRQRRVLQPEGLMVHTEDGRRLVNFSSNDYLGLAADLALAEATQAGLQQPGLQHIGPGSAASALVTGYQPIHQALETELAEFLERDSVLLCSSGYQANLAVAGSLAGRADSIIQDRLCHASLIDGARLSGARLRRYPHLDMAGLQRQLQIPDSGRQWVVSDGIFSMDGDAAPVAEMAAICSAHEAGLVIDDAHGIGVCGPGGRGLVAAAGLDTRAVPVLVGTLGKAFGCAGAFIAGSTALIEQIVNEGRSYLFTTAMSPVLAVAGRVALKQLRDESWRREALHERIFEFRSLARDLPLLPSDSPIQPLVLGDSQRTVAVSEALAQRGYLVSAIRPPTVPAGTSRLRITLSAGHSAEHVRGLVDALQASIEAGAA